MKRFNRYLLGIFLFGLLGLTFGCLEERPLGLIEIYDSELQPTRELSPLDTLWVKVSGLEPNKYYTVEVLDPNKNLITKIVTQSDENGVIGLSPLWYEVGLTKNGTVDTSEDISIRAFYIHVYDDDRNTDFEEPFWIVIRNQVDENSSPKPIVYACLENGTMENSFDETGTKVLDSNGNLVPGKTKIYVYAENLNGRYIKYDSNGNGTVDVYIVPFDGTNAKDYDGEDIGNFGQIYKKVTINVICDPATNLCKTPKPELIWDLDNDDQKIINPKEGEGVFRVIVDIDKDGIYEVGEDVDKDGIIDIYRDGIDGASVAGFIIKNTPANDLEYTIKDNTNATVNYIGEYEDSTGRGSLYLNMYNLPVNPGDNITICLLNETSSAPWKCIEAFAVADSNYYLPVVKNIEILNTQDNTSNVFFGTNIDSDFHFYIYWDKDSNGIIDSNDKFINYVTVKPKPEFTNAYVLDSNGKETIYFNETNSEKGTKIYVEADADTYVYVYKAGEKNLNDILDSSSAIRTLYYFDINYPELLWDLNDPNQPHIINPTANNNAYDIIFDKNRDGIYDSNDVKYTILIKDTPANDIPNVNYANIASGGKYKYKYDWINNKFIIDWDYRDYFDIWASDTSENPWYGVGKGIKAVWNPLYDSWYREHTKNLGDISKSPVYYGEFVDVYIVDANKYPLWKFRTKKVDGTLKHDGIPLSNDVDVRGRKTTLSVQWSCKNGLGQQNIWHPPLKVGKYYVIVDVDRDGNITEGVDIIDAVNSKGETIKDNSTIVGFSVVENLEE